MDYMNLKVSDIGEKALISKIIANCKDITDDDAAITSISDDLELISSCDMLIQSKHFPKEMSYYHMGYKAVTVNVSDLAAMGAKPLGFLLSIAVPKDFLVINFKEIIRGVYDACCDYEISFIGGDTNEANEIIISGTSLGLNNSNSSLRKYGFLEGDLICVTGEIGLAALGFNLLGLSYKKNNFSKNAVLKCLSPKAKIKEGLILKDLASSATDITDGLASELYELFNADKKNNSNSLNGLMIYEDKLVCDENFKCIAEDLDLNYFDLLLHFGEDFELLFTIDKSKIDCLNFDYNVIGEVNSSNKVEITLSDGSIKELSSKGYDHYGSSK